VNQGKSWELGMCITVANVEGMGKGLVVCEKWSRRAKDTEQSSVMLIKMSGCRLLLLVLLLGLLYYW
jgi:hypothetical protein